MWDQVIKIHVQMLKPCVGSIKICHILLSLTSKSIVQNQSIIEVHKMILPINLENITCAVKHSIFMNHIIQKHK